MVKESLPRARRKEISQKKKRLEGSESLARVIDFPHKTSANSRQGIGVHERRRATLRLFVIVKSADGEVVWCSLDTLARKMLHFTQRHHLGGAVEGTRVAGVGNWGVKCAEACGVPHIKTV